MDDTGAATGVEAVEGELACTQDAGEVDAAIAEVDTAGAEGEGRKCSRVIDEVGAGAGVDVGDATLLVKGDFERVGSVGHEQEIILGEAVVVIHVGGLDETRREMTKKLEADGTQHHAELVKNEEQWVHKNR